MTNDFGMLAEKWIDDHDEIIVMEADEIARKAFLAGVEAAQHSVQADICPRCEGTGKYQRLGFATTDCAVCNGTGKCR